LQLCFFVGLKPHANPKYKGRAKALLRLELDGGGVDGGLGVFEVQALH
jgi:hypothetical protein